MCACIMLHVVSLLASFAMSPHDTLTAQQSHCHGMCTVYMYMYMTFTCKLHVHDIYM